MNKAEIIANFEGVEGLDLLTVPNLEKLLAIKTEADKVPNLENDNKAQLELLEELNARLEKREAALKSGKPVPFTFKIKDGDDKGEYELITETSKYEGKIVTRETLKADSKLREDLVRIKAGTIRKIEK